MLGADPIFVEHAMADTYWLVYAAIMPPCAVGGYLFYQWRANISFEKYHRTALDKKNSLWKLFWGFLGVLTALGAAPAMIALFWKGEMYWANLASSIILSTMAGGVLRHIPTMRIYRKRYRDVDPLERKPRKAA